MWHKFFIVSLSLVSSVTWAAGTRIECQGSINGQKVMLAHTGKMVPGDIDNDYQAYCAADEKLYIDAKMIADGGLEALGPHTIVEFKEGDLPKKIIGSFKSCSAESIADGGLCLHMIATDSSFTNWKVLGHDSDTFQCHEAPIQEGECSN